MPAVLCPFLENQVRNAIFYLQQDLLIKDNLYLADRYYVGLHLNKLIYRYCVSLDSATAEIGKTFGFVESVICHDSNFFLWASSDAVHYPLNGRYTLPHLRRLSLVAITNLSPTTNSHGR